MRFAYLLTVCLPLLGCSPVPPPLSLPQNFAIECRSERDHQFLGSRTGTEIFLKSGVRWRIEFVPDSPAVSPKIAVCDGSRIEYVGYPVHLAREPSSPLAAIENLYACANAGRYRGVVVDEGHRCHQFSFKEPSELGGSLTILFYADSLLPRRVTTDAGGVKINSLYTPLSVNPADFSSAYDTKNKTPMLKELLNESNPKRATKG